MRKIKRIKKLLGKKYFVLDRSDLKEKMFRSHKLLVSWWVLFVGEGNVSAFVVNIYIFFSRNV